MQNGIIYYPDSDNIGDDIQTYAASLLVDNPVLCDRERLDEITENTRLLCNGWFMHEAEHWPPSKTVHPLFVSFHISSKNGQLMTSPKAIEYYKRYQPIGCRDHHTVKLLKSHNVEAYYTGCLTLTLPKYTRDKGDEILFVDVLRSNYSNKYRRTVVNGFIPDAYKDKVKIITHLSEELKTLDSKTRMEQAKNLLDRYAKAKVVFTSLIHCALPCVALGTPVVFIDFGFNNNEAQRDRFDGITDLFHTESELKAPIMKRNIQGKLGRGLGLYHIMKNQIEQLPEDLFQPKGVTTKHLKIASSLKATVREYFEA